MACYVVAFALIEKVRKEQFVVGLTNSKTKKLLLQLINQMPNPVTLVSKKGQILFCNAQFETMVNSRLGIKTLPTSIFKLATEEDDSCVKLKDLVNDFTKNNSSPKKMNEDKSNMKSGKIEIRLVKNLKKSLSPLPRNKKSPSETSSRSQNDETRTKFDNNLNQKEVFDSKVYSINAL
jgi:hypothetical protein